MKTIQEIRDELIDEIYESLYSDSCPEEHIKNGCPYKIVELDHPRSSDCITCAIESVRKYKRRK